MVAEVRLKAPPGTSLRSLVRGFILTKHTEGKSPRTIQYYDANLKRFLWYAGNQGWPDDAQLVTEWDIREFLGYVADETCRWGLDGNGSERCRPRASHSTVHHYFAVLRTFFGWCVKEGFLTETPLARVSVANAKPRVIQPYTAEELSKMLAICDWDYQHNARFLGSRNKAIVLMLLDTGLRLNELVGINLQDIDSDRGWIKVMGKGSKERVVRIGQAAQKALWRYMIHRGESHLPDLWLTEERRPLQARGVQMVVERLKQRAGVHSKGSVHRFRHSFALSFLRVDKNPFNLQYLLGHGDLRMVRYYVATLGMEDALQAHVSASPADHLGPR